MKSYGCIKRQKIVKPQLFHLNQNSYTLLTLGEGFGLFGLPATPMYQYAEAVANELRQREWFQVFIPRRIKVKREASGLDCVNKSDDYLGFSSQGVGVWGVEVQEIRIE